MPNYVYATYVVVGDEDQIERLYHIMKNQEETEKNEFNMVWIGHLISCLGGDPNKLDCREWWYDLSRFEGELSFSAECAWHEQQDTRQFIEHRFPGIKIWFECIADDFWVTNDKEGKYFNKYYLYTEELGEDYFRKLEQLISVVENITGASGLKTLQDCEKALDLHFEDKDDSSYYIGEFEIID